MKQYTPSIERFYVTKQSMKQYTPSIERFYVTKQLTGITEIDSNDDIVISNIISKEKSMGEKEVPRFQVGDRVMAIDDKPKGEIGTVIEVKDAGTILLVKFDTWECGHDGFTGDPVNRYWNCQNTQLEHTNQPINKSIMTNIIEFAKNITLSNEEKLLREMQLKDSCGDYTDIAKKLVFNKLTADNEAYLLEIATKMKAEVDKK